MKKPLINVYDRQSLGPEKLREIFRLRAKVFSDRLNWDVRVLDGMEVDGYDALEPYYLTIKNEREAIIGCWRLLSTEGPYMLKNSFTELLNGQGAPSAADIWELSRFAVEGGIAGEQFGFSDVAIEAIVAVISYGFHEGITRYITVTTPAIERMLRRIGVVSERFTRYAKVSFNSPVALLVDIAESHSLLTRRQRSASAQLPMNFENGEKSKLRFASSSA